MRKRKTFPDWWETIRAHAPKQLCACGGEPSLRIQGNWSVLIRCGECGRGTASVKVVDNDWLKACIALVFDWGQVVEFAHVEKLVDSAIKEFVEVGENDAKNGNRLAAAVSWTIAGALEALQEGLQTGNVKSIVKAADFSKNGPKTTK